ncbi:MAG: RNA polymerase subunit sigma, partial [Acidobacteria bacterium]|nr:RNA polymerase subunit sigma [Acidobacteriota bacterium]
MTRDDDTMLVKACLQGDQTAFDQLVDRYEGTLFNATYRITGSVEDAMDATQAAFVNAYEKL